MEAVATDRSSLILDPMRLSLGQDLRLVQKQVLAPRMIQSMEILQLPILALEERIEQEMEENPVLELVEEEPELARRGGRVGGASAARRPQRGRARTGDRRDPLERAGFRAADEDGRGVARPLRGARPSVAGRDRGGRRTQARRDGQHGRPAPIAARLPPRPVGLVRPGARPAGDGRPHHLQPRCQRLSARAAGGPVGPRRRRRGFGVGPAGVGTGAEIGPARRRRQGPARMPAAAIAARRAVLRAASAR